MRREFRLLLLSTVLGMCWGHGRLVDPPSRASAWRFGWGTPIDYNDNEGFCGGFNYQYNIQGGRCGICGDAWDENPRPHEAGGKYATGTIVRKYTEGQVIPIKVEITSNHRGHFEFRICPNNNPKVEATQTCLNDNPLFLADGSGFKYQIPNFNGEHIVQLQLPEGLTCTQCVFQWRYVAGNNWGICEDGSGQLGCGKQEEFRACADVEILSQPKWSSSSGFTNAIGNSSKEKEVTSSYSWYSTPIPDIKPTLSPTIRPPPPSTTRAPAFSGATSRRPGIRRTTILPRRTTTPRSGTRRTTRRPRPSGRPTTSIRTTTPLPSRFVSTTEAQSGDSCHAVGIWSSIPGMDEWCVRNCFHVPPFCPPSHCTCD